MYVCMYARLYVLNKGTAMYVCLPFYETGDDVGASRRPDKGIKI